MAFEFYVQDNKIPSINEETISSTAKTSHRKELHVYIPKLSTEF